MDRIEYGTDGNTYKFWISNGKEYADSDRAISLNAAKDLFCRICMESKICYRSKETCVDLRLFDKLPLANLCKNAISREEVLLMIDTLKDNYGSFNYGSLIDLSREVRKMPPVNPQRPTGHWINTGSGQECSECGEIQHGYDNFRYFCANCGARMFEPQERSEDVT